MLRKLINWHNGKCCRSIVTAPKSGDINYDKLLILVYYYYSKNENFE